MPKFLSLLVVLFTLFPSSSRAASPTEPIVLDLYIMGLCPFAQILEANLAPLLEDPALGSRVKTNLNFIVTEKKDGSLKSLHGKKELLEDQRQLLINHYHPDKLWTYLKCRARNPDYKVCAEKAGLNPAEIERAVKSGEGMKLLKENRKKAERKGVSSSPTVFLNGKRFPEKQKLPRRLCRFHTPPTRPCHNLEEMEWVWDDTPVVSSGSCQDKNGVEMTLSVVKPSQSLFDKTGFLVSQLTRTFPKLQPRFYTPDTWSGPVFSRLPVYLFDKRVAQSTKFFDFTKNLSARKDGYLLKAEGQNFYLDRQPVPGRIDFIYSPVKITDFLIELLEFLEAKNDGRVKLNLRPVVLAKGEGSARRETDEIRRRYVIRHDYPEKFLPYLKAWLKEPDKTAWQNPLKKIGLNPETIKARSNTAEIETLYLADITFLVNLGVHEWPVFLFNNQEVGGVRNLKEFTYCYDRLEGFLNREVVPQSEAGHTDVVTATAISADGTYAVSGSKDHSLIIWNPVTGGEIRKLAGHRGRITSVALDEKRGWLISGGTDQKIRIWNKDTGQLLKSLASKWTTALALTPDGKYLLSGSQEKSDKNFVKVWDLASGKVMRSLPGHADRVSSMGITPDGRYVITGSWDDYEVKIREFSTGRVTARLPGGSYHFLAVSQDNERVVTGGKDGLVKLWDLSGKLIKTMRGKHDNVVMSVLLSPDGRTVASAGLDGTIRFWEAATGKQTKVIADQGDIFSLSLDKNGDRLISGNADSSVKVWSFPEGELRKTLGGKKSPVTALALRGGWIYAGRRDGWLIAREVKTKKIVIRVFAHQGGVNSLAVSPDRNWLISGGDDGYLKVWRADTGELVRSVKSGGGRVSTVAVSPDGKTVASGNWDKNIRIWERATGKLRKILTSHDNMVSVVAFNPQDSNKLVSASWDETIRFWDLATGKTSRTLKGDFTYIRSLAFSPDGKEIACENLYHQVQVWNAEEGTLLTATAPEMGGILSLVYSKNGKRVYAAYEDNAVRVWNHYSGKLLKTLSGHSSEVTSLALAETALISGGKDGDIRIWPLNKQHGL